MKTFVYTSLPTLSDETRIPQIFDEVRQMLPWWRRCKVGVLLVKLGTFCWAAVLLILAGEAIWHMALSLWRLF